ncbi:MAG: DUF3179 domain-containing protein [Desulfobacterales bacterium]|nr:DUF3179 domain-containing protein [Desulfobacterales bacterium]
MYSREIDDQTLTLAPSGWTYRRTFVLYDKETGTLWYPRKGSLEGIQGKYFKRRLPRLQSTDTKYNKWVQKNPDTKVMK